MDTQDLEVFFNESIPNTISPEVGFAYTHLGGGLGEGSNLIQSPGLWASLPEAPGLLAGPPPVLRDPPPSVTPVVERSFLGPNRWDHKAKKVFWSHKNGFQRLALT